MMQADDRIYRGLPLQARWAEQVQPYGTGYRCMKYQNIYVKFSFISKQNGDPLL